MYRYPAGAKINDRDVLAGPAVLAPCLVRIDGILHGPEICDLMTAEELAELGIYRVVPDPLPVDANGWTYEPGEPVDVHDGLSVRRTWPNAVPDVSGWEQHQTLAANAVRAERNSRLTACDWTQIADAPLTSEAKAAWAAYRQALRNVPEQPGFPMDVVWPVEPE